MIQITVIVLIAVSLIEQGGAIKCYQCSSVNDSRCADSFTNSSTSRQLLIDCSAKQVYDLTPIEQCRKIRSKENDKWIVVRDCNVKDNKKLDNAQVFLCDTEGCNSATNHHSITALTILTAVYAFSRHL